MGVWSPSQTQTGETTEAVYIGGTPRGDVSGCRPGNDRILQKRRRHDLRAHYNEYGMSEWPCVSIYTTGGIRSRKSIVNIKDVSVIM
jgi:hypothetical protein